MPRPALPEPKLRRSRCPRDPKDQQLKFTQLNWLLSVFVDNSWEGRRHDMGLSHSLWVCFLVFKSHLCVARAKHKMFKESDLSRKARATSTPSTFRTQLRCFDWRAPEDVSTVPQTPAPRLASRGQENFPPPLTSLGVYWLILPSVAPILLSSPLFVHTLIGPTCSRST